MSSLFFNIIMSTQGFKRKDNSGIAIYDYTELTKKFYQFVDVGYWEMARDCIDQARHEVRDDIRLMHRNPIFKDKDVRTYGGGFKVNKAGKLYFSDLSQFRLGHFGMMGKNSMKRGHADTGTVCSLNIYANYYARWWSTGSKGHRIMGGPNRAKGYPPHGFFWDANNYIIEKDFAESVEFWLSEKIPGYIP